MTRRLTARTGTPASAQRPPRPSRAPATQRRPASRGARPPAPSAPRAPRAADDADRAAQAGPAAARDPVPAILHAAGELIDELGFDGLSTTAVARRAGISTATLYRHFPDKHAVLRALVLSLHEERAREVLVFYERFATEPDWRRPLAEGLLATYRMRLARPGGRATRRALQTSPELWQWDQRQNEELWRAFAKAIRRRRPALSRPVAERIAMTTLTATVALLDLACFDERRAAAILEEAEALRSAYLAPYLD